MTCLQTKLIAKKNWANKLKSEKLISVIVCNFRKSEKVTIPFNTFDKIQIPNLLFEKFCEVRSYIVY